MQAKINYRYYALLPIHLMILAIIVVGTLVGGLLWRVVGAVILGFGVYAFLAYWTGVVLFSRRRKPDDLPSEIAGDLVRRGHATIRLGRPEDAPAGARLMYETSPSMMGTIFGTPKREAVTALRRSFPLPGHTASYTSTFVVEDRGQVVGLLAGYTADEYKASVLADWVFIPIWLLAVRPWQIARMFLARSTYDRAIPPIRDGDYFIEYLAVSSDKRGQGIGSWLLDFAERLARAEGLERITLDVEIENEGARRFYERAGFEEAAFVADKRYRAQFDFEGTIRMVKPIE